MFGRKRASDIISTVYGVAITSASIAASAAAGYYFLKTKGIIM